MIQYFFFKLIKTETIVSLRVRYEFSDMSLVYLQIPRVQLFNLFYCSFCGLGNAISWGFFCFVFFTDKVSISC